MDLGLPLETTFSIGFPATTSFQWFLQAFWLTLLRRFHDFLLFCSSLKPQSPIRLPRVWITNMLIATINTLDTDKLTCDQNLAAGLWLMYTSASSVPLRSTSSMLFVHMKLGLNECTIFYPNTFLPCISHLSEGRCHQPGCQVDLWVPYMYSITNYQLKNFF